MLVLGRQIGESILIGDDIVVTLVGIGRDSCRIGIEAPKRIPIVRTELLEPEGRDDDVASTAD